LTPSRVCQACGVVLLQDSLSRERGRLWAEMQIFVKTLTGAHAPHRA